MGAMLTAAVPRLLPDADERGTSLRRHLEVHGTLPAGKGRHASTFVEAIAASGLLGRGGAAFPTARKLAAVAGAREPAVVVANGAEGEPASDKDAWLLEAVSHLVLDGALLAAQVSGAADVLVCVRESAPRAHAAVSRALAERAQARMLPAPTEIVTTPGAYLAGEENALVSFLNGGPVKPTFAPPRVVERGVAKRPTLVQNIETLAHIALIARYGPDWFREAGTPAEPGTRLVTLSGAVTDPGVYEIEPGARLRDLLAAAGGATAPIRALLLGGYFGSWIDGELADEVILEEDYLRPLGAGMGAGVVVVLPESACPVAETARVSAFLSREAAGQCGPCTHGLGAIAAGVERLAAARAEPALDEDLARWQAIVPGRGACRHPDGAVRFVASALEVFAPEFRDHREHGPCTACGDPRVLPIPRPR